MIFIDNLSGMPATESRGAFMTKLAFSGFDFAHFYFITDLKKKS